MRLMLLRLATGMSHRIEGASPPKIRKETQSHAFGSPVLGEHREV
jgi:hypothetical protein